MTDVYKAPYKTTNDKILFANVNITPQAAHNRLKRGRLERIAHGIYIESEIDTTEREDLIRSHACRIANFLYPSSVLASISSWHQGVVRSKLHLASSYGFDDKNIGGIFDLIFTRVKGVGGIPSKPIMLVDSVGKYEVKAISAGLAVLMEMEDLKKKGVQGPSFSADELNEFIKKELATSGKNGLMRQLQICSENFGYKNAFANATSLVERLCIEGKEKKSEDSYSVLWHKKKIGNILNDGSRIYFVADKQFEGKFFKTSESAWGIPRLFESLMSENRDRREVYGISANQIRNGQRYLSNIDIVPDSNQEIYHDIFLKKSDYLQGTIKEFTAGDGVWFSGQYVNFLRDISTDRIMIDNVNDDYTVQSNEILTAKDKWDVAVKLSSDVISSSRRVDSPKIPGYQIKAPMYLSDEGLLKVSHDGAPFTHILKFPNNKDLNLCVNEYFSTQIAQLAGLKVQNVALLDVPGFGASLLMERFDIRTGIGDKSKITCHDFLSILDKTSFGNKKYDVCMLNIAGAMMSASTNVEKDAEQLMRQVVFSWVIGNGDMHAKNISMITWGNARLERDISVTLSPAYDLLSSQANSGHERFKSALPIGGSILYDIEQFLSVGKVLNMNESRIFQVIEDVCLKSIEGAPLIREKLLGNKKISNTPVYVEAIDKISELCTSKANILIEKVSKAKQTTLRNKNNSSM